jgi:hypothetical protein
LALRIAARRQRPLSTDTVEKLEFSCGSQFSKPQTAFKKIELLTLPATSSPAAVGSTLLSPVTAFSPAAVNLSE